MFEFNIFKEYFLNKFYFCSILNLSKERKLGMARKKSIKTDIVVKNYWRDNARFANLFNAVLFEGGQVILPEDLEDI